MKPDGSRYKLAWAIALPAGVPRWICSEVRRVHGIMSEFIGASRRPDSTRRSARSLTAKRDQLRRHRPEASRASGNPFRPDIPLDS